MLYHQMILLPQTQRWMGVMESSQLMMSVTASSQSMTSTMAKNYHMKVLVYFISIHIIEVTLVWVLFRITFYELPIQLKPGMPLLCFKNSPFYLSKFH